MNDLLTDSFEMPRRQPSRGGDIEMGTNSVDMGLDQFFKKIDDIDRQIEKFNKLLKKLQDANEESKSVTKAAAMKAIKQRMEKDVDEVGKIALSVKTKIEQIDRDNLTNRQKPGCGAGTAVDRTRSARTGGCTQQDVRVPQATPLQRRPMIPISCRPVSPPSPSSESIFAVDSSSPFSESIFAPSSESIFAPSSESIFAPSFVSTAHSLLHLQKTDEPLTALLQTRSVEWRRDPIVLLISWNEMGIISN